MGNILIGLQNELTFECLALICVGVALGIVFGSIPGLSANMAVTLCLPLTYSMDAIPGITLLISLYLGGISGGLISAILINIPGTPASIATCFDGSPLAKRGEAGKALGTGILASFIGGLFSILLLIFISPSLAKIALKFGPFEYAAVGIFSLSLIASLSGKSISKGLLSAVIGIALATVGAAPVDGAPRFTFGISALGKGFDIITVMIGLFAVTEVIETVESYAVKSEAVKPLVFKMKGLGISLKEFFSHWFGILRAAAIGTGIGILPGLGGSTANVIAYSVAQNASKYPEKFGTGIIDGVIASETSNNATVGGALIPLLTLGIPGDVTTAILLGALTMKGITAGPLLFNTEGDLVYSIFVALLIANVVMLLMMFLGMRGFVKLLSTPKIYLLPIVMLMCLVGAFAVNNRMFDMWCVLFFGVLGYLLKKAEIPFAPLVMGFILGPTIELYLRRASMLNEGDLTPFFTRPIPAVFLLVAIAVVMMTVIKQLRARKQRVGK